MFFFVWIAFFVNGISTFVGYLMPEPSLQKDSSGTILPKPARIKKFIPFPKDTSQKVNIIA